MWTATLDLSPRRVLLTQLLGRFWRGAYLSSFAPLRVENMPRQQLPGLRWVRVRNRLAGICGSDLHLITADGDLRVAPAALPGNRHAYLGHEVVGEVIEVSDGVQHLQVGDRVVLEHGMNCVSAEVEQPCRNCANGNYTLCERGVFSGPQPIGGGWSEEMLLHEQQLFRVPQAMTDEQAVLLEPTAVAIHAVLRHIPHAGERVLITGAGTIGLLTLQVVRLLAPQAEISVMARYPFQVEKATRMGASHIIYPQDSYHEVQKVTQAQLYEGMFGNRMLLGGYDVIYDTIGNRGTISNALRWTRAKGTIVLVGLHLHLMNIDLSPVWYQEINLFGTNGHGMERWPLGTHECRSTFDIATDMIQREQLRPEQLISHHFALSNYRTALRTAMDKKEGRAIKVVFDYSLQPASVVPNVRASARSKQPTLSPTSTPTKVVERELTPVHTIQPVQVIQPPVVPAPAAPHVPVSPIVPVVDEPLTVTDELPSEAPVDFDTEPASLTPSDATLPAIAIATPSHMEQHAGDTTDFAITESTPIEDDDAVAFNGHYKHREYLEPTSLDEPFYAFVTSDEENTFIASDIDDDSEAWTPLAQSEEIIISENEETFTPSNALLTVEQPIVSDEVPPEPFEQDDISPSFTSMTVEQEEQRESQKQVRPKISKDKSRTSNMKRRKKTHYLVSPQEVQHMHNVPGESNEQ